MDYYVTWIRVLVLFVILCGTETSDTGVANILFAFPSLEKQSQMPFRSQILVNEIHRQIFGLDPSFTALIY